MVAGALVSGVSAGRLRVILKCVRITLSGVRSIHAEVIKEHQITSSSTPIKQHSLFPFPWIPAGLKAGVSDSVRTPFKVLAASQAAAKNVVTANQSAVIEVPGAKQSAAIEVLNTEVANGDQESAASKQEELLRSLRTWPLDADLDKYLEVGKLGVVQIDLETVRRVLSILSEKQRCHKFTRDGSSKKGDERGLETHDAVRALNLFKWWEKNASEKDPPFQLLHYLLRALSYAKMKREVDEVGRRYKHVFTPGRHVASNLIEAYLEMGLLEEVLKVYAEALDDRWLLTSAANRFVLRALRAVRARPAELLMFYKHLWRRADLTASDYILLLQGGVTVKAICAVRSEHKSVVYAALIRALTLLDRRPEAIHLAERLAKRQQVELTSLELAQVCMDLVMADFDRQARALVRVQEAQFGRSLVPALLEFLSEQGDAQESTRMYKTLMWVEGLHKVSLEVQERAVLAFWRIKDDEGAYMAYRVGASLKKGPFHTLTYGRVIRLLCKHGKALRAEEILEDYYAARNAHRTKKLGRLRESTYNALFKMYEAQGRPDRIVWLVEGLVQQQLLVGKATFQIWIDTLIQRRWNIEAFRLQELNEKQREYGRRVSFRNRYPSKLLVQRRANLWLRRDLMRGAACRRVEKRFHEGLSEACA